METRSVRTVLDRAGHGFFASAVASPAPLRRRRRRPGRPHLDDVGSAGLAGRPIDRDGPAIRRCLGPCVRTGACDTDAVDLSVAARPVDQVLGSRCSSPGATRPPSCARPRRCADRRPVSWLSPSAAPGGAADRVRAGSRNHMPVPARAPTAVSSDLLSRPRITYAGAGGRRHDDQDHRDADCHRRGPLTATPPRGGRTGSDRTGLRRHTQRQEAAAALVRQHGREDEPVPDRCARGDHSEAVDVGLRRRPRPPSSGRDSLPPPIPPTLADLVPCWLAAKGCRPVRESLRRWS